MYSITDYVRMMNDDVRTGQYINALKSVINHESVVLDIGTGTGLFALVACHYGARRVYALEPDDSIHLARELASANGYTDKITFLQELSTKISLSEKATVIVSDLRGVMPLYDHHIEAIIDARERHLAKRGVLIPRQDILQCALVHSPTLYETYFTTGKDNAFKFDMQPLYKLARNLPRYRKLFDDETILVTPQSWCTLDYHSVTSPNARGKLSWTMEQDGLAHGYRLWFDCELIDGFGYSTAPGKPKTVYGNMFLPLSEPVVLRKGDTVDIELQANLVGQEYIWRWDTWINSGDHQQNGSKKFRQSSFESMPLSLPTLHKQASDHRPDLNEDGVVDLKILTLMNKGMTLKTIADDLCHACPDRFRNRQQALQYIGTLSVKYSR